MSKKFDFNKAERFEPVSKNKRAIVSVAFDSEDFQRISKLAADHGKYTSEFIRDAVLEKAHTKVVFSWFNSPTNPISFTHTGVYQ